LGATTTAEELHRVSVSGGSTIQSSTTFNRFSTGVYEEFLLWAEVWVEKKTGH
jgi:hypothetical protein